MNGRRIIYTNTSEITQENILEVLHAAYEVHEDNRKEIDYLYEYYRGKQPILIRTKNIRPEINNKIVENRAYEIITFKDGYLLGDPLQYVNRGGDENTSAAIGLLNEYMFEENKEMKDRELSNWFHICGTAYRMCLPSKGETPFNVYTLDPRNTFVVYHNGLGNKPVMGVMYVVDPDDNITFSVYTEDMYYEITDEIRSSSHIMGMIPIIEYPAGLARLGAFEVVLPMLDAINTVSSNRLDGIEQFIQALLMFKGVDIDGEKFDELISRGGIRVPIDGDVEYLVSELNQTQTQTLIDYMVQTVLTICNMPNRNGGSSTSDTGKAVIMRDGWSAAEGAAKDSEVMFKGPEKQFLRLALRIARTLNGVKLRVSDIELRFTRRNYENILEKAQVLAMMLGDNQIHPKLAFEHSGMFADPNLAYTISKEYYEKMLEERLDLLDDVRKNRQNNPTLK